MDIKKYGQEFLQGKNAEALRKVADSEAGRRVASMLDPSKVERAAKDGDTQALEDILRQVMSTPDGKALAEQVKKAVSADGRRS
jgi:hypothetical protein